MASRSQPKKKGKLPSTNLLALSRSRAARRKKSRLNTHSSHSRLLYPPFVIISVIISFILLAHFSERDVVRGTLVKARNSDALS
jgi:hypothetical protein